MKPFPFYFENDLIPAEALAPAKYVSDEHWDSLASSSTFLPRLQVMTGNSGLVSSGKISPGRLGLVKSKEEVEDLGNQIDCIPLSFRYKAMSFSDNGDVVSKFNPSDPEFKKIQEKSSIQNSGCMAGIEFLLWLPNQDKFCTFYLASVSARKESANIRGLIGKGATIKTKFIESKRYKWHAPVVTVCSSPLDPPEMEALKEEMEKFNNPKESEVELADSNEGGRDR